MKGLNTVLIIILILVVAGFGMYWYTEHEKSKMDDKSGLQIKIGGNSDSDN